MTTTEIVRMVILIILVVGSIFYSRRIAKIKKERELTKKEITMVIVFGSVLMLSAAGLMIMTAYSQ